jgi:hypothetical protein
MPCNELAEPCPGRRNHFQGFAKAAQQVRLIFFGGAAHVKYLQAAHLCRPKDAGSKPVKTRKQVISTAVD